MIRHITFVCGNIKRSKVKDNLSSVLYAHPFILASKDVKPKDVLIPDEKYIHKVSSMAIKNTKEHCKIIKKSWDILPISYKRKNINAVKNLELNRKLYLTGFYCGKLANKIAINVRKGG